MIDPKATRTPSYVLPLSRLYAVLMDVSREGTIGSSLVVNLSAGCCQKLTPEYHVITRGIFGDTPANCYLETGDVVQHFVPGDTLAQAIGSNPATNHWLSELGPAAFAVSKFDGGMLGLDRALHHAMEKELTRAELFQALREMTDPVLEHALDTNLKSKISEAQHRRNIAELQDFAQHGTSEEAGQIRIFLGAMESPNDRINRLNVWRMVLIVRAIQRRAAKIVEHKLGTNIPNLIAAHAAVSAYIADVVSDANRMAVKLENRQAWWTNYGHLPAQNRRIRRSNMARWLGDNIVALREIRAKPFRAWANIAEDHMEVFQHQMESATPDSVIMEKSTGMAVMALRAMTLQVDISRAILKEQDGIQGPDEPARTHTDDTCSNVIKWLHRNAELGGKKVDEVISLAREIRSSQVAAARLEGLRRMENWMASPLELIRT